MALSDSDIAKLEAKRVTSGSRPTFYNADTQTDEEISLEMEQFATLVDPSLREEILDRLGASSEVDADYNAILQRASDTEEADAEAMLEDFSRKLDDFDAFRTALLAAYQSGAGEVSRIQHDIRRPQDRAVESYDTHFHRRTMAKLLLEVHTFNENNPDADRQRASWSGVFEKYA